MTKRQKKEALISVRLLEEAQREIKEISNRNNYTLAKNMLAECQEVAKALGEYIEKIEGTGHITISFLEEYCEILFQIYEELLMHFSFENNTYKRLKKQLIKIENSIHNDICSKTEIVFLPYKASMWDSFESIYLAAKEDLNCMVYCVPIPYFDLNPDQSFGQMHYEAEEYPDYVEVTDWRFYNIAKNKPDIVYIHNPYDNHNFVTSVYPEYYSDNLKKYSETLVYIPYNVTGGIVGEIHRLLPAYFNVDYIIVQHERQIKFFAPEIANKVNAIGSPKFDAVINQTITKQMIPVEWKPKLKNVVLFINTGIDGILKHNKKSLLKIQYILKIAEEENVTLIWRPHPLLEATIHSIRPELWDIYLETVDAFCKYENGILDHTKNAELAIGLSDAYIGEDTSSISHMFGVLGKPLFFIRQNILKELEDIENIKISCCTVDTTTDNILWAVAANRNGLVKISNHGIVEAFYIIPHERDISNLYSDIIINKQILYLIPRNAKEIAIFDINKEVFNKILLPHSGQKEKFNKAYLYNNKIYLIPRLYKQMVILDCIHQNLFYNSQVVDNMKEITGIPDILVSANGSMIFEENIFIAAPNKPYVLIYNINSQKITIHKIKGANTGFCCIEKVSDKIVLGGMQSCELIIWNVSNNSTHIIRTFPEGWSTDEEICFWNIVELENNAYIFPRKNSMILKLSVENISLTATSKVFPFSIKNRKSTFFNHPNHFLFVKKMPNNKIFVQDANNHGLSEFFSDGTFRWLPVTLTEENELRAFKDNFSNLGKNLPWGIYETKYYSVRRLISYVRQKVHDTELQKKAFLCIAKNLDGTAGQKIHDFIMDISNK